MKKIDYKKDDKDLYLPKRKPALIDVPELTFFMVDGQGDPNDSKEYQNALSVLYALSYTVKMKGKELPGYYEHVVFPLEGLWWCEEPPFDLVIRDRWLWTSLIRQPDYVTAEVFAWALALTQKKKPELDFSNVRMETWKEGLCVQMMHMGPYAEEAKTVERMHAFMDEAELVDETGLLRKHHEIYISDPRKVLPEKQKTVLRLPVSRKK